MACKSETSYGGGGGVVLGDFNHLHAGYNDVIRYDGKGNHGKLIGGDGVPGIWYHVTRNAAPAFADNQHAKAGNEQYLGTFTSGNVSSLTSLCQHPGPAIPSSVASGSGSVTSSDMGNVWSAMAGQSHGTFNSDVTALASVPWPPASVTVTSLPGCDLQAARDRMQAPPVGLGPRRPTGEFRQLNSDVIKPKIVIPTPCRKLTVDDVSLFQNQAICKAENPEDINPEHFVQRIVTSSAAQSPWSSAKTQPNSNEKQTTPKRVSYLEMVAKALMSSPDLCLPLVKIYSYIEEHYPQVKTVSTKSWKNSVRHTLSLQPCFYRAQGVMTSLHAWKLHSGFLADFRANQFHSGLIKKRAKDLNKPNNHRKLVSPPTLVVTWSNNRSCGASL